MHSAADKIRGNPLRSLCPFSSIWPNAILHPTMLALALCIASIGQVWSAKRIVSNSGLLDGFDISSFLPNSKTPPAESFPPTAFIAALYDSKSPITIQTKQRINRPGICNTFELTNLPVPNHSPLMGPPKFSIITERLYNGHFAWTNGQEYLSFINHSGDSFGNWLIGVEPGVDSGYVYLSTDSVSFTPLGHDEDDNRWMWSQKSKWTEVSDMRAVCVDQYYADQPAGERHYFSIEYWDPETAEVASSFLVPDVNPFLLSKQEGKAGSEDKYKVPDSLAKKTTNGKFAAYLNKRTSKWVLLHSASTLAVMGAPVLVNDDVCVLVKEEHGGNAGWRLSLHVSPGVGGVASDPYQQRHSQYEHLVEVNNEGVQGGYRISPLPAEVSTAWWGKASQSLRSVKAGDYVWLWVAAAGARGSVSAVELLAKCVSRHDRQNQVVALFEWYDSNRGEVLRQTILERDSDLVRVTLRTGEASALPAVEYRGAAVQLLSSQWIGPDIVGFVRAYLVHKEGHPHGMSSCYMYHAAVSLPQVLVYAAEIVCVLIGAKPLTMIQYTSVSENQWKFPLVRELSQAIIASRAVLGAELDVEWEVFTYQNDESLIIYRSGRRWVAEGLVPHGKQAQALHPLPYPDTSRLDADHRLQIFNAAWNGHLLGYPDYFVESYCETFHNDLDVSEKKRQARLGKQKFQAHLKSIGQSSFLIKMGLEKPIKEEHFQRIAQAVAGRA